jgi:hypothetical protein
MMDEKLLQRLQAGGTVLVLVSYFMPWASVATPLGSLEVRGLYVDFAWAIPILAIIHLIVQFARFNMTSLGLPDNSAFVLDSAWKGIPFVCLAFFTWYGAAFVFRGIGAGPAVFGTSLESVISAGLDYGFWIGTIGAVLTVLSVGLGNQEIQKFASLGAVIAILVVLASIGIARINSSREGQNPTGTAAAISAVPAPSPPMRPPESALNSAPYVTITKVTGNVLPKDIEESRFSDAITISPVFKNVGTKTIVGLQGRISMVDGFGKEVYGFNFRADDKLAPREESTGDYRFEGNQFEDDDPYHKMLPLLQGGTAKYRWTISRIAFDDGTVLPK